VLVLKTRLLAMGAVVFIAAALAACGGGGGGGGGNPVPTPVVTQTPVTTSTISPSSTSTTTAAIPPAGGYSGTIDVPSGSGSATVTDSLTNPSGTPVLQIVYPKKSAGSVNAATTNTPLLYITITAGSAGLSLSGTPGFVFNVPSSITGSVYVAIYQPPSTTVWTTIAGPVTISGSTATFPIGAGSATLAANAKVYLALYQGGVVPAPSSSPTLSPYGCVGSSPFAVAQRKAQSVLATQRPIAPGDTFAYSGSIQTTYTQSAPCPEPTVTSSASASASVTDSATSGPSGATTNQHSAETDVYPRQTVSIATDLSLFENSTSLQLTQTKTSDSSGDAATMTYAHPQQLDVLPEAPPQSWGGAGASTNDPSGTYTEALADGTHVSRTVNSDGTYRDTETYADGTTASITVNADGSGVYNYAGTSFSYAAPSGGNITLTIGASTTRTFPAWFTVPSQYITDSFTDSGPAAFDSHCSLNAAVYGTQGNKIVETYAVLDPVLGYTETRTTTSYVVSGYGAVCVAIDDNLKSYYDYQFDTTKIDYQSKNGQPNSVDDITEYLSMTAPATPYSAVRRQTTETHGVSAVAVATRVAAIEHTRAVQRAQRIERMHRALRLLKSEGAL
jgi:hypothetical protein